MRRMCSYITVAALFACLLDLYGCYFQPPYLFTPPYRDNTFMNVPIQYERTGGGLRMMTPYQRSGGFGTFMRPVVQSYIRSPHWVSLYNKLKSENLRKLKMASRRNVVNMRLKNSRLTNIMARHQLAKKYALMEAAKRAMILNNPKRNAFPLWIDQRMSVAMNPYTNSMYKTPYYNNPVARGRHTFNPFDMNPLLGSNAVRRGDIIENMKKQDKPSTDTAFKNEVLPTMKKYVFQSKIPHNVILTKAATHKDIHGPVLNEIENIQKKHILVNDAVMPKKTSFTPEVKTSHLRNSTLNQKLNKDVIASKAAIKLQIHKVEGLQKNTNEDKNENVKKMTVVDDFPSTDAMKANSKSSNETKSSSVKKTIVPHAENSQPNEGVRRHHIFHETTKSAKPSKQQWEYRRYHVFHKVDPDHYPEVKREHMSLPYTPMDDNDAIDDDDDYEDERSEEDEEGLNDDDDDDFLAPSSSHHHKVPMLNIETPNMSGVPEGIRNQLKNSAEPEHNIDKGRIQSPTELHEPVVAEFISSRAMKDVDSVRKSLLNDDNMFSSFLHGDLSNNEVNKQKMSEEELEALKEDQAANSLMRTLDKAKAEEQPEVVGFGKHGMAAADKATISASLSSGAVPDPSLMGREGIDTSAMEGPKEDSHDDTHHKDHQESNISTKMHFFKPSMVKEGNKLSKMSEHAVDKQKISDSDYEYHHPVSEVESFHGHDKQSDYEMYDEGIEHDERPEGDESEHSHMTSEHEDDNDTGPFKPAELTMKSSTGSVEDTIKRLQSNDAIESEKLIKKFTSSEKHPLIDKLERLERPDEDDFSSERKEHFHHEETEHIPENHSEYISEIPNGIQDDGNDILDPEKAQERATHYNEQVEMARKVNTHNMQEESNALMKTSDPSTGDVTDSLSKNPHGTVAASFMAKAADSIMSETMKVDMLTPEDALHALNGKKTIMNDEFAKITDDPTNGPPDAVINAIQSPINAIQSPSSISSNTNKPAKEESTSSSAEPGHNATVENIEINDISNDSVAKEVVNILESLGQLKATNNSQPDAPKPNLTKPLEFNRTKSIVEIINPTNNSKTDAKEALQRATVVNKTLPGDTLKPEDTLTNISTVEDMEEKETKEAVHDLNIAITILEKKLALINEAKKSGNRKAIYIVNQLRSSKPITKSKISRGANYTIKRRHLKRRNSTKSLKRKRHHRHLHRHLVNVTGETLDVTARKHDYTGQKNDVTKGRNNVTGEMYDVAGEKRNKIHEIKKHLKIENSETSKKSNVLGGTRKHRRHHWRRKKRHRRVFTGVKFELNGTDVVYSNVKKKYRKRDNK